MFNLLVKFEAWGDGHDRLHVSRVGEYTDEALIKPYRADENLNFELLAQLPTLFVQETANQPGRLAKIGRITRVRKDGSEIVMDYSYETGTPPISNELLSKFASELDIKGSEIRKNALGHKGAGSVQVPVA